MLRNIAKKSVKPFKIKLIQMLNFNIIEMPTYRLDNVYK